MLADEVEAPAVVSYMGKEELATRERISAISSQRALLAVC